MRCQEIPWRSAVLWIMKEGKDRGNEETIRIALGFNPSTVNWSQVRRNGKAGSRGRESS